MGAFRLPSHHSTPVDLPYNVCLGPDPTTPYHRAAAVECSSVPAPSRRGASFPPQTAQSSESFFKVQLSLLSDFLAVFHLRFDPLQQPPLTCSRTTSGSLLSKYPPHVHNCLLYHPVPHYYRPSVSVSYVHGYVSQILTTGTHL